LRVSQVLGGEGVAAVVAVGDEAVGGVAAANELFSDGAVGVGSAKVLFDGAIAAASGAADDTAEEFGEGWSFAQSGSTRVTSNIYWGVESLAFCSALFASSSAFIFVSRL
jgi:hypothetical protein